MCKRDFLLTILEIPECVSIIFACTNLIEFLTLCQGRAPIMWTCAIQNTSWHNHLPPQTIYHWRTSSFIVQKSSRCPRDKTNGLLLIHYLLKQSNFNKVLLRALFIKQLDYYGTKPMDHYSFMTNLLKNRSRGDFNIHGTKYF